MAWPPGIQNSLFYLYREKKEFKGVKKKIVRNALMCTRAKKV